MDRNSPDERTDYWREAMKYFVFADPHGDYEALWTTLFEKGYDWENSEHQLIGLGDYFGRAMQSKSDCVEIWRYLTNEKHVNKPICLKGNHEDILTQAIRRRGLTETDICNGEHNTFASFAYVYPNQIKYDSHLQFEVCQKMFRLGFEDWLEFLPGYYETEHYVFTHGFVPLSYFTGASLTELDSYDWNSLSWVKTPDFIRAMDEIPNILERRAAGKTIVFGHWRAKELNEKFLYRWESEDGDIYFDEERKLIGLDCTTVLSHKVGCIVLEDN